MLYANKTEQIEKVEGMTYRPNTQTKNIVLENNFVPRGSLIIMNSS